MKATTMKITIMTTKMTTKCNIKRKRVLSSYATCCLKNENLSLFQYNFTKSFQHITSLHFPLKDPIQGRCDENEQKQYIVK